MNFVQISGILGATGVALGAFGAHGLKKKADMTPERLGMFNTASHYQLLHAVAVGALGHHSARAAYLWVAGTVLFSGSLYAYGFTGEKKFGMIAPIGGTLFIAGWVALAFV
jgi:uncharacterized membrane protein YgdD (TMEM256/DUF423 family)